MSKRIVVKKYSKFIDVFHGEEGFEPNHWTRLVQHKGRLLFLKGAKLADDDYKLVVKEVGHVANHH